jgi:hypothetical protein
LHILQQRKTKKVHRYNSFICPLIIGNTENEILKCTSGCGVV